MTLNPLFKASKSPSLFDSVGGTVSGANVFAPTVTTKGVYKKPKPKPKPKLTEKEKAAAARKEYWDDRRRLLKGEMELSEFASKHGFLKAEKARKWIEGRRSKEKEIRSREYKTPIGKQMALQKAGLIPGGSKEFHGVLEPLMKTIGDAATVGIYTPIGGGALVVHGVKDAADLTQGKLPTRLAGDVKAMGHQMLHPQTAVDWALTLLPAAGAAARIGVSAGAVARASAAARAAGMSRAGTASAAARALFADPASVLPPRPHTSTYSGRPLMATSQMILDRTIYGDAGLRAKLSANRLGGELAREARMRHDIAKIPAARAARSGTKAKRAERIAGRSSVPLMTAVRVVLEKTDPDQMVQQIRAQAEAAGKMTRHQVKEIRAQLAAKKHLEPNPAAPGTFRLRDQTRGQKHAQALVDAINSGQPLMEETLAQLGIMTERGMLWRTVEPQLIQRGYRMTVTADLPDGTQVFHRPTGPKIEVGAWVRPKDRDNLGRIVQIDNEGKTAVVYFLNRKTGAEAAKRFGWDDLNKASLEDWYKALPSGAETRKGWFVDVRDATIPVTREEALAELASLDRWYRKRIEEFRRSADFDSPYMNQWEAARTTRARANVRKHGKGWKKDVFWAGGAHPPPGSALDDIRYAADDQLYKRAQQGLEAPDTLAKLNRRQQLQDLVNQSAEASMFGGDMPVGPADGPRPRQLADVDSPSQASFGSKLTQQGVEATLENLPEGVVPATFVTARLPDTPVQRVVQRATGRRTPAEQGAAQLGVRTSVPYTGMAHLQGTYPHDTGIVGRNQLLGRARLQSTADLHRELVRVAYRSLDDVPESLRDDAVAIYLPGKKLSDAEVRAVHQAEAGVSSLEELTGLSDEIPDVVARQGALGAAGRGDPMSAVYTATQVLPDPKFPPEQLLRRVRWVPRQTWNRLVSDAANIGTWRHVGREFRALAKATILYSAFGGYIILNSIDNMVRLAIDLNIRLPKAVATYAKWKLDPNMRPFFDHIKAIGGEGQTVTTFGEAFTGGKISAAVSATAKTLGHFSDDTFREIAVIGNAQRMGIGKDKLIRLASGRNLTKAERRTLLTLRDRSNDAMIEFGRMGNFERQFINNFLFIWAFNHGYIRYSLRFPLEHPYLQSAGGMMGLQTKEDIDKTLGPRPTYAEQAIPTGGTVTIDGKEFPATRNVQGINTTAGWAQLYQVIANEGGFAAGTGEGNRLYDQLSPEWRMAIMVASGYDPFRGTKIDGNLWERAGYALVQSTPFGRWWDRATAGDVSDRIFPEKGWGSVAAELRLKSFRERGYNKEAAAKAAARSRGEKLSAEERARESVMQELEEFRSAAARVNERLPANFERNFEMKVERDASRAEATDGIEPGTVEYYLAAINADIDFMLKYRAITPRVAEGERRYISSMSLHELKKESDYLSRKYFQTPNTGVGYLGVISEWRSWLNERGAELG